MWLWFRLGVHFKRFRGMFRHSSSIPLQHGLWGICLLVICVMVWDVSMVEAGREAWLLVVCLVVLVVKSKSVQNDQVHR